MTTVAGINSLAERAEAMRDAALEYGLAAGRSADEAEKKERHDAAVKAFWQCVFDLTDETNAARS